jgi:hypothetical protein
MTTFGRLLQGEADELVGFEQTVIRIQDPEFVASSGKADHAIVRFNGRDDCRVPGMVFEISDSELSAADAYEPAGYSRIAVVLASGRHAFVYVSGARRPGA